MAETFKQTVEEIQHAHKLESQVLANLPNVPNPTELEADRRYYKGYRGELAVRTWLQEQRIEHEFNVNTSGRGQKSEFILTRYGRKRLEVKTQGYETAHQLLIGVQQKLDFTVCVSVHLTHGPDSPDVAIVGWLGINDVLKLPIGNPYNKKQPSRICPYSKLRPMFKLEPTLLKTQSTDEWAKGL